MKLEFIESLNKDVEYRVYLKGVEVFTIRYADYRKEYWIDTRGFINFQYYGLDETLDFVQPHKYSKTLKGVRNNCKKIMYSYINWLTEK